MRRLLPLWLLAAVPLLHGGPVEIRTSDLPWAIVNTGYHFAIETGVNARCPDSDVVLSLSDGTLPHGIEMRGGYLLGIPKETGKPILRVYPQELTYEVRAGQAGAAPLTVQVSATWPDLPYSIGIDAPWLTQKVQAGVAPDAGSGLRSDVVSLGVDAKNLAPGVYRTSVRFSTWLGANSPAVPVTLKVVAAE